MAIAAVLVESTPYRLVYRLTQDGAGSPIVTTWSVPNDGGATPDLETDSLPGSAIGGVMRQTGLANQAAARALLLGDGAPGGAGGNFGAPRCHSKVVARSVAAGWGVDANVDGQGDAVSSGFGPANAGAVAYLHIVYSHSEMT